MQNDFKISLIGKSYRIYHDSIAKKGFMGIGRILEVDSFNGYYALCRVKLIGNRNFSPVIDCWVDVSENSPDYCRPAILT